MPGVHNTFSGGTGRGVRVSPNGRTRDSRAALTAMRSVRIVACAVIAIAALAVGTAPAVGEERSNRAPAAGARLDSTALIDEGRSNPAQAYRRIVSLSPSTTEILFALGLGDRVVGVTRFCNYPPAAKDRQRVGGYLDPNYEAIASLRPDLVILLPEQEVAGRFLDELGLRHITVNNKTVREILGAVEMIGAACGAAPAAHAMIDSMRARVGLIRGRTEGLPRPRVLIAVDCTVEAGSLREVYVAGRGTHYDELLRDAGGVNAYEGRRVDYPMLSVEGIIHCNPDIIIDIRPLLDDRPSRVEGAVREWRTVAAVEAVRNGRVHVLTGNYTVVPGPRFVELLEAMARIVHSELDWNGR